MSVFSIDVFAGEGGLIRDTVAMRSSSTYMRSAGAGMFAYYFHTLKQEAWFSILPTYQSLDIGVWGRSE
jgi:hypothetical protein